MKKFCILASVFVLLACASIVKAGLLTACFKDDGDEPPSKTAPHLPISTPGSPTADLNIVGNQIGLPLT